MLLENRHFGWLEITQKDEKVSKLKCIPETVFYVFAGGIYDAKVAAGLEWDDYSKTWLPDPNHPTVAPARAPILMDGTDLGVIEECLPSAEFKLDGIMLGYRVADLGKPIPPVAGEVIIEGVPEIERFMYDGLRIDTFQGAIIEMEATASDWEMPSGLKVGLTRVEVIRILGRVPNEETATSQTFGSLAYVDNPDSPYMSNVVIEFRHDKRVQSIRFALLSP